LVSSPYTSYADKFELLLEMFPFPDREDAVDPEDRKWRNSEIAQATMFRLSGSYLSQLRQGKIDDPSLKKLDLIGEVLGFPRELWAMEPEKWGESLLRNDRRGLRPEDLTGPNFPKVLAKKMGLPGSGGLPRYDTVSGEQVCNTPQDVAARSRGRLTAEDVQAMLDGRQRPSLTQILALTETLGVQRLSEWMDPLDRVLQEEQDQKRKEQLRLKAESPAPSNKMQETTRKISDIQRRLLLRELETLEDHEVRVALEFVRRLPELRDSRPEGDSRISG
jgi:hypothetical protein